MGLWICLSPYVYRLLALIFGLATNFDLAWNHGGFISMVSRVHRRRYGSLFVHCSLYFVKSILFCVWT